MWKLRRIMKLDRLSQQLSRTTEAPQSQQNHVCIYPITWKPLSMSKNTQYILVSLPTSISSSNDHEEAFGALQATVARDSEAVLPFTIPEFKIGTLDALVQQADDLAKLESACETVANKVGDSLKTILEGDEGKIAQQKTVNDSE